MFVLLDKVVAIENILIPNPFKFSSLEKKK